MKILFVCLGNICRSPMAEAMFDQMAVGEGVADRLTVDSAGTSSEETGNRPHPGTRKILAKYGIPDPGMIARQINQQDFIEADYIITMDDMNLHNVQRMCPAEYQHKLHAIFDLIPSKKGQEIPDPWYTHRFQETYDALSEALPTWMNLFKQKLNA